MISVYFIYLIILCTDDIDPHIKLDFLLNDSIKNLHENNYTVQEGFVNNKDFIRRLYKELNFLERDGKFDVIINNKCIIYLFLIRIVSYLKIPEVILMFG